MSCQKSYFKEILNRRYESKVNRLPQISIDDEGLLQRFGLLKSLPVHQGCVNTICWNEKGNLILSGSDDQHLVITNGYNYKLEANHCTSHHANIFSAKFLPCTDDKQIVSCSGDGIILHTDLTRPQETYHNQFNCHSGTTTYEVITVPHDPSTFLSCGEDGTVRLFDLRTKTSCYKQRCKEDILVSCQRAITAISVNPKAPHQLAVGCADSVVRIYDRRFLSAQPGEHLLAQPFCTFVAPNFGEERNYRITSLNYDESGKEMLVSYSSDYLYLFGIQENSVTELKKKTTKKASPWDKLRRDRHYPPPVRRLRLRGDWSDTGPAARPERDNVTTGSISQARPELQATLMQRMTDVLSRMLNDPMTRAALSAGGEDSVDPTNMSTNSVAIVDVRVGGTGAQEYGVGESAASMDTDDREPSAQNVPQSSAAEVSPPLPETSQGGDSSSRGSSAMTSQLHTHLTALRNLREGFINQHGAEPSVSFRYSQQSTSNSTISLRVGNEVVNRAFQSAVPTVVPSSVMPSTPEVDAVSSADSNLATDVNMAGFDVELEFDEDDGNCVSEPAVKKTEQKSVFEAELIRKYHGHRNARTMIKEATFWGRDYVMSGSDCGHVFVWNRHTGDLKMLLQADQHVVNCLQPHPTLPILATSGIDHDIKLWAPTLEENGFDQNMANVLITRNAIMLEETRDTITVPAAFMIRMLACLNQIRRGGARARNRGNVEDDS